MPIKVSWNEIIEKHTEMQKRRLPLFVAGFHEDKDSGHRIIAFSTPEGILETDIDTTLSIPHRGGLRAIERERRQRYGLSD